VRYVDVCCGWSVTHLDVTARDAAAAARIAPWLRNVEGDATAHDERGLNHDADAQAPRIAIVVGTNPHAPIVETRYGARTLALHAPPSGPNASAPLRRANIDEAIALGLSWALGADRVGCFDPLETLFPMPHIRAEAWVLDLRDGIEAVLATLPQIPKLPRADRLVQLWCGAGLPRSHRVDALTAAFGADDADAWALLDPHTPLPGRAAHPHVLVATLVVSAPCLP
jgi:hypothetical protein